MIDNALGAAGTNVAAVGMDKLGQVGVLYHGLEILGGGAVLSGVVLASIGAFVIDRKFMNAAAFAGAGALMTFFGLMHGEANGVGQSPVVAASYLGVCALCVAFAKLATVEPLRSEQLEEEHGHAMPVPAE
jgi:AGZA family xanthine/uracil permease-like MFS transporter